MGAFCNLQTMLMKLEAIPFLMRRCCSFSIHNARMFALTEVLVLTMARNRLFSLFIMGKLHSRNVDSSYFVKAKLWSYKIFTTVFTSLVFFAHCIPRMLAAVKKTRVIIPHRSVCGNWLIIELLNANAYAVGYYGPPPSLLLILPLLAISSVSGRTDGRARSRFVRAIVR